MALILVIYVLRCPSGPVVDTAIFAAYKQQQISLNI